jgi:hypothetical protein
VVVELLLVVVLMLEVPCSRPSRPPCPLRLLVVELLLVVVLMLEVPCSRPSRPW